tara:strand:+ start:1487 stop:3958 length:2472 start_codon:yes stop_codon:yes gene_type:complete
MALTKITNSAIADNIGLGGNPTTSTQTEGDNSTRLATTAFVSNAVANLVGSAPDTLNTLAELATSIGNSTTLSSTLTNSIATKLPLSGGSMTGPITTNSTFDGRDIATDGIKLDGIATSANNYTHPSAHAISFITGLQTALDGKIDDSQVLTDVPSGALFTDTVYTLPSGYATEIYVGTQITNLVNSAPAHLNTLSELATAMTANASGVTTLTTSVADKLPLAGGTLTGNLLLDVDNAEINLKSGVGTTSGAVNWTLNSTGTDYASIKLPYATRASIGLHIDSGYPITLDGTTSVLFALSGNNKATINNSGLTVVNTITASGGNSTNWNTAYTYSQTDSDVLRKRSDIPASANLNSYTAIGLYHQNSDSNATSGSNYPANIAGMLTVTADGVMVYQTYQGYGTNGTYERKYYNGTWEAWHLIWDSGIFANNSANWNTAYTVANAALPKAGGTMTGALNMGANQITNAGVISGASYNVGSTPVIDASRNGLFGTISTTALTSSGYVKTPVVGIGANAVVAATVGHNSTVKEGLFWHSSTDYSITRTVGTWAGPDYQQLKIDWPTGIELDGGTATGKSGVNVVAGNFKIGGTTVIDASRNLTAAFGEFSGSLRRTANNVGHLEGSYDNVAPNNLNSNPIYTIGSSYNPASTTLSNMYGIGYTNASASFISMSGASGWGMYVASDGDARVYLSGQTGGIAATGNITAYASDARLKTNIKPIENALEKLNKIRGVEYDWVDNITSEYDFHPSIMHETGVIAQEIQEVIPDAVTEAPMNANYTAKCGTDHKFLTVQKDKIVPLLIEAVKEQQKEIDELKSLVKQLLEK